MATGKNLEELLKSAEKAVMVIEDEDRKRIAFERVLDHLLNTSDGNQTADDRAVASPVSTDPPMADSAFADEQQRTDEIAEYFGIEPEQVYDIFDLSDDNPRLRLSSTKLSKDKAGGTREIALLITGARTALGRDTDTAGIRAAADDYGRLDSSHFMSTVANMKQLSLLGKRHSSNRAVRMKFLGAEEAKRLAQKLVE